MNAISARLEAGLDQSACVFRAAWRSHGLSRRGRRSAACSMAARDKTASALVLLRPSLQAKPSPLQTTAMNEVSTILGADHVEVARFSISRSA